MECSINGIPLTHDKKECKRCLAQRAKKLALYCWQHQAGCKNTNTNTNTTKKKKNRHSSEKALTQKWDKSSLYDRYKNYTWSELKAAYGDAQTKGHIEQKRALSLEQLKRDGLASLDINIVNKQNAKHASQLKKLGKAATNCVYTYTVSQHLVDRDIVNATIHSMPTLGHSFVTYSGLAEQWDAKKTKNLKQKFTPGSVGV